MKGQESESVGYYSCVQWSEVFIGMFQIINRADIVESGKSADGANFYK
jgi:hypothetical protein